jgi:hypothetical protein
MSQIKYNGKWYSEGDIVKVDGKKWRIDSISPCCYAFISRRTIFSNPRYSSISGSVSHVSAYDSIYGGADGKY